MDSRPRHRPDRPLALVVTTAFPPRIGGIEQLAWQLARGMQHHTTRVLALDEPEAAGFDAAQPFPVHRVYNQPSGGRRSVARLAARLPVELIRQRPDVILSMHIRASYALPALSRPFGIPVVQYVHAQELADQPELARRALHACAATIAVSEHAAAVARGLGAGADRLHIIPPGVELAPAPSAPVPAHPPTLITVARLEDRYKGHATVMAALPRIRAAVPDVRWRVVGEGSLRAELEAQAARLGVRDAVEFTGAISDAARDRAMAAADVFIMPTQAPTAATAGEGFGIVFLEAGAAGLPVIAGDAGGPIDAVRDGETGLLVDASSPAAVADAAISLLQTPETAAAYGRAGRAWAARFSWPGIVARVEAVLAGLR